MLFYDCLGGRTMLPGRRLLFDTVGFVFDFLSPERVEG